MADNLKQKALTGAIWSGVHKFAITLLGFISGIVLARLLTPHDYGVIGMLTIFLALSQTFIDGGFGSALIQKKSPTDTDYSTILYWNIGLSIILYIILFFSAPLVASFYNLPILSKVLRVQGFVLIINAARIVQRNQLRKKLQFKKIAVINVSANLIALAATIYLAKLGWGVWALVAQQLLVALLTTSLYWITSKWKPLLIFSKKSFKELFSFGGYILLSNLFSTVCGNIQGLFIGKIYNSSTLGLYTKAMRTESYSSTFISSVLDQVSYPVLSESQNDRSRMIRVIKQFITTSAYITFPLMFILILLAKPLFLLLYSDRWLDSVPYFQILCIAGIAISIQNINYFAVAALGKSKELLKWTFIKRSIGLLLVVGGLFLYGIYGLLFGSVAASWIIYFINARLASIFVGYSMKQQLLDLFPITLLSIVAFVLSYCIAFIPGIGFYLKGIIQLVVFLSIYLLLSFALKLDSLKSTRYTINLIKEKFFKSFSFVKRT